ncbi:hypothetical protein [Arthrobacter mobilis]|uniref:Uncharacterized protein n=1 Tax=Arthrobacter mobilis TaxID=2724944 RepID=A0A7X6K800_9MICC|nr:hypothetical protein [Arthrobacter mobilis]NKX56832.1 hypothetical protein [Arthrobacter mobilis]
MSISDTWPPKPAWAEEAEVYLLAEGEGEDLEVERRFTLKVSVGQATATMSETHLRLEGEENAGLIEKIGPYVSISPEDITPEIAADVARAIMELLQRYNSA